MKRPFSLMEVLIGLALTAMVLGMLFTSLYETSTMNARLEKARNTVLLRAELQQRLDAIFSHLSSPNDKEPQTSIYLTQTKDSPPTLHFKFEAGIDPNPSFSGEINGLILLEQQTLFLAIQGNDIEENNELQMRKETLKKGVKEVKYEFLSFEQEFDPKIWKQEAPSSPAYIKLTLILVNEQEEEYVFWINTPPEGVPIV